MQKNMDWKRTIPALPFVLLTFISKSEKNQKLKKKEHSSCRLSTFDAVKTEDLKEFVK